jgi:tRNA (guanosine-2'-O-)-methyltransferase
VHHVHLIGDVPFQASRGPCRGANHWLDISEHDDVSSAGAAIREAGYAIWVADLAHPPVAPAEVPIDKPVCLWFGAELVGVSDEARAAADGVVTIPMRGFSQSLNISVAAALVMGTVTERVRATHGDAALLSPEHRLELLAAWLSRDEADLAVDAARQRALELLGRELRDEELLPP